MVDVSEGRPLFTSTRPPDRPGSARTGPALPRQHPSTPSAASWPALARPCAAIASCVRPTACTRLRAHKLRAAHSPMWPHCFSSPCFSPTLLPSHSSWSTAHPCSTAHPLPHAVCASEGPGLSFSRFSFRIRTRAHIPYPYLTQPPSPPPRSTPQPIPSPLLSLQPATYFAPAPVRSPPQVLPARPDERRACPANQLRRHRH